ncbi:hypothetical protein PTSG_10188 [Salpingoeca rosetta]|uniref:Uncharacterized protein n=1 Tax=Salpingoeca rosetta (strain ATCC 50818 / BSB-021) TaxID=946362 RepID=F2UQK0_SALR5|nr:uncharacterized protein PTSG_10188 [Salpingoeca rosetta]EGD79905.1 hypothetical protein PTSG_10188 [Salpingoeca rosetta]|eukprot:XP_004988526.1 hypothetical protein PTSG_10188 [Salpingoeca rosetta]
MSISSVSASEWALIAAHLVPSEDARDDHHHVSILDEADVDKRAAQQALGRAFFNLMLTCRELYHDLPWAMPKWCLSRVYNGNRAERAILHWLDTFQSDLLPATTATAAATATAATTKATTTKATTTASAPAGSTRSPSSLPKEKSAMEGVAWMESRFLAHCWLGAKFDSKCTFLRARLSTPTSPEFWHSFGLCGHVMFGTLNELKSWSATQQQQQHQQQQRQPQEQQRQPQQPQQPQPQQQHEHKTHQHPPEHQRQQRQDAVLVPQTAAVSTPPKSQQKASQGPLAPALYSLNLNLTRQEDVDCFHQLHTRLLARARGDTMFVLTRVTIPLLTVSNVKYLTIKSFSRTTIDSLHFHDVEEVEWHPTALQRAICGTFRHTRHVTLHVPFSLDDIAALAGVPEIELWSSRLLQLEHMDEAQETNIDTSAATDVSPLRGARQLGLHVLPVLNEASSLEAAQRVSLTDVALTTNRLANATSIRLANMKVMPDVLHLPKATEIELVESDVKQITCPAHLDRLYIHNGGSDATLPIPSFEFAKEVQLKLFSLAREQLADLGSRVDTLVLHACVRNMSDLHVIPDHVHVCVSMGMRELNVDVPAPPCVQELQCLRRADFPIHHVAHVPRLTLPSTSSGAPIRDLYLLSNRQRLSLEGCTVEGEITGCRSLFLRACRGAATVTATHYLSVLRGAIASEQAGDDVFPKLRLARVRDVSACHLDSCSIQDFACMQNVQRLVLRNCTFDSVDTLPPVASLRMLNCTTSDKEWAWPWLVLINRTPEEMRHVLLAGKKHRRR